MMGDSLVFIRVDANDRMAIGHLMRCCALARAFSRQGKAPVFLTVSDLVEEKAATEGFPCVRLAGDWSDLLKEVDELRRLLSARYNPLLIVDTYSITKDYVEILAPFARVCYLGSKNEFLGPLSAIINYSAEIDEGFYRRHYGDSGTKLLLGLDFAPLREEFERSHVVERVGPPSVLITTGGTDPHHMAMRVVEAALMEKALEELSFHVVIGALSSDAGTLRRRYGDSGRVVLHEDVASMGSLMADCDIAVSANGTTVYELAAVGVPAITFAMVDEQISSARKFDELGFVHYCGEANKGVGECVGRIVSALKLYGADPEARRNLAAAAHAAIDGKGCSRIVAALV